MMAEYEESGLSRGEFADQKGINRWTFSSWFSKKMQKPKKRQSSVKFAEVSVALPQGGGIRATLELPKGGVLRIEGLSVRDLAGLIREAV